MWNALCSLLLICFALSMHDSPILLIAVVVDYISEKKYDNMEDFLGQDFEV